MKNYLIRLVVLSLAFAAGWAQQPAPDELERYLFPPELVMRNQEALGLTDRQQEAIIALVQEAQQQFTGYQWKLQREVQRLASLLGQPRVDEGELLAQLDEVFAWETRIKKTHMLLVVGIKNQLTEAQQELLLELKSRMQPERRDRR